MPRTVKIYVADADLWLLEAISKIVAAKKKAGRKSSLSWELCRLAKNGITRGVSGAELDRQILQGSSDDNTKTIP